METRHRAYASGPPGEYRAVCFECGWSSHEFADLEECRDYALVHRDEETRLMEQDEDSRYRALEALNPRVGRYTDPEVAKRMSAFYKWKPGD